MEQPFEILELACPLIIPLELRFLLDDIIECGCENGNIDLRLYVKFLLNAKSVKRLRKRDKEFPKSLLQHFSMISVDTPFVTDIFYLTVYEK